MAELRKDVNLKSLLSLLITGLFLLDTVAYAIDFSDRAYLRVPHKLSNGDGAHSFKKLENVLSLDEVEKILLKAFYSSDFYNYPPKGLLNSGSIPVHRNEYKKYLYLDGNIARKNNVREYFYRAGDIFIIDKNYSNIVPEKLKKSNVKLIYLDFHKDYNQGRGEYTLSYTYRHHTILGLIALQLFNLKGKIIVDAGAGNGVASIASVLLGAKKVFVVDCIKDFEDLIVSNAKDNGVLDYLDFSYFGKEFEKLAENDMSEKVEVAFINLPGWGILGGELQDILSSFKCQKVVLSGGNYVAFAKEAVDFSIEDFNVESEVKVKRLMINFFKSIGLRVLKVVEAPGPYYNNKTTASFLLEAKEDYSAKTKQSVIGNDLKIFFNAFYDL